MVSDLLSQPRTADDLKALARQLGVRNIRDLLAMSMAQDPFYAPWTRAGKVHAQWFADLWHRCGYTQLREVHLRRMHYKILSAFPGLLTADTTHVSPVKGIPGSPYANTEDCFAYLVRASHLARASRLVDPAHFADHRNPTVMDHGYSSDISVPSFAWDDRGSWHLWGLPTHLGFALNLTLPKPSVEGYGYASDRQPYLLEVWVEKSTMDDVLAPLVYSHGVRVVTSVGFQSITNVVKFLHRAARAKKPARLFYISDYDPAGAHMPSAVARQLEYYHQRYAPDCEIKLEPVVLTKAQVQHYQLPRIPIKESDARKGHFEDVYGEGAVELDALEALHPGELRRILRDRLDPYIDSDLRERLSDAEDEANERLQDAWNEATGDLRDEATEIEAEARAIYKRYDRVLTRLAARLERDLAPMQERVDALKERITAAQDAFELPEVEYPEPEVDPQGEEDWLYSSDRAYLEQNMYYQARKQGRTVGELSAEAGMVRTQQAADWAAMQGPFPEGCPPYNARLHTLGRLCKRGHAWGQTGKSLRFHNKGTPACLYCHAESHARRRTRTPDEHEPQWVYDPTRITLRLVGAHADAQDETEDEDEA
jgi:hypothetical protein